MCGLLASTLGSPGLLEYLTCVHGLLQAGFASTAEGGLPGAGFGAGKEASPPNANPQHLRFGTGQEGEGACPALPALRSLTAADFSSPARL